MGGCHKRHSRVGADLYAPIKDCSVDASEPGCHTRLVLAGYAGSRPPSKAKVNPNVGFVPKEVGIWSPLSPVFRPVVIPTDQGLEIMLCDGKEWHMGWCTPDSTPRPALHCCRVCKWGMGKVWRPPVHKKY